MKLTKIAMACALMLAGIHQASADVTIHIVGSTAFRAATVNAIINRMTNPIAIYTDDGSSITGSNNCTIKGSWPGIAQTTTIQCAWSGSVAGIQAVTGHAPTNPKFLVTGADASNLAVSYTPVSVSGSVASGGSACRANVSNTTFTAPTQPEISMADNYQVTTVYPSPSLTDAVVGIIPFAWVASGGAPAGLTNVGPNVLKALYTTTGYLSAEVLTGNTADRAHTNQTDGTMIYALGRDNLSGTRVGAFAESGIGVNNAVAQYTMSPADTLVAITNNTVTDITLDDRIGGVVGAADPGNGGESSGGTLADNLRYTSTSVVDDVNGFAPRKVAFIGYLGESDSYRAVAGNGSSVLNANAVNARYLSYNGVSAFSGTFFNNTVTTTNLSPTVTTAIAGGFTGVVAGQALRGANIPADAVVQSVSTTTTTNDTITMNVNATGSSSALKVTVANLIATPVREGTYTFWAYEHIMWGTLANDSFGSASDKTTVATGLRDQIKTGGYAAGVVNATNKGDYFAAGIGFDSAMQVKRTADGGPVITTY